MKKALITHTHTHLGVLWRKLNAAKVRKGDQKEFQQVGESAFDILEIRGLVDAEKKQK